ncbi:MAG TPA: hypothetical protein P5082_09185, partial [Treponema sp.]|nr:hypothetical protein [Treponema sp.]
WALYRAIGHLLFHLVLGDSYYGRARLSRKKVHWVLSGLSGIFYCEAPETKRFISEGKMREIS